MFGPVRAADAPPSRAVFLAMHIRHLAYIPAVALRQPLESTDVRPS